MKQREDLDEATDKETENLRERLRKEKDALAASLEKSNEFLLFEEVTFRNAASSNVTVIDLFIILCTVSGRTLRYSGVPG